MKILVTGGAGFIGSALIHRLIGEGHHSVLNIDALTYAGNLESLREVSASPNYEFLQIDLCDRDLVGRALEDFRPEAVIHLATESHVDRSIDSPTVFARSNVLGTTILLEEVARTVGKDSSFRFLHVSTDEVYGDLGSSDDAFNEDRAYAPSSPYSASKAASNHFVQAWHRTFGLPTLITRCGNNYGPRQFPEKLIPHMILKCLAEEPLPLYGDGSQQRDWIHVDDHVSGLLCVLENGRPGESYNIGADCQLTNASVVEAICTRLDSLRPRRDGASFTTLIQQVPDRPGSDLRYAVDTRKIRTELGWTPSIELSDGLEETVRWYLDNEQWWQRILDGSYRLERIGKL